MNSNQLAKVLLPGLAGNALCAVLPLAGSTCVGSTNVFQPCGDYSFGHDNLIIEFIYVCVHQD